MERYVLNDLHSCSFHEYSWKRNTWVHSSQIRQQPPLNNSLGKDVDFEWGPEHQEAFEYIQDNIASIANSCLLWPDQVGNYPMWHIYGRTRSSTLPGQQASYSGQQETNTEQNYSNIEREMLAIVFALTRFHHDTYERHGIVESDHKPLDSITKKPVSTESPRIKRMLLKIQLYDYTVKYVPGKKDASSWHALQISPAPPGGVLL